MRAAVLLIAIPGMLACREHRTDTAGARVRQVADSERTQATLDRLSSLVQDHRWVKASEFLRTANPRLDAERAFAEAQARYFAGGNFYFSLPSVPHSEDLYNQFDAWQPFPGTGDSSESAEQLAYQEVAEEYIAAFNARLHELRSN